MSTDNNEMDPFRELANLNFIGRVFFWASFEKAQGSTEPYWKLVLASFVERTRNFFLLIAIIFVFGLLGKFLGWVLFGW